MTHAAGITAGEVDQGRQGGAVRVRGAGRDRVCLSRFRYRVKIELANVSFTSDIQVSAYVYENATPAIRQIRTFAHVGSAAPVAPAQRYD